MDFLFLIPCWITRNVHPVFAWVLLILYFSFLVSLVLAPFALIGEALEKLSRKGR
jgi:hypothetical protein